jgi:hypothetical protein
MALCVLVAMIALVAGVHEAPTSASGAPSPSSVLQSLAVPKATVTVSPAPGSRTADPQTEISFLGRPASSLGTISVVGSESGAHAGRLLSFSTGNGASFVPNRPFVAGEQVTVHTTLRIAGATKGTFRFVVAHVVALRARVHPPPLRTDAVGVDHFASAPKIAPPSVRVDLERARPLGGDFLLTPKGTTGQAGPMIVRPDGQLIWFDPLPDKQEAFDLNVQRLYGQRVLTWFQGEVVDGHGQGEVVIANRHYRTVAVVKGGNGTKIDLHDLYLTNRGTVFVTAYRTMRWNLSSDHGSANGTVFDGVVQEIDLKTGLVEEEWDSLDHVPVSASDFAAPRSPSAPFDYFHINGVQPLPNGELLVSSRNTSAVFLVDPADEGKIVWQLGGKHSSFSMGPGTRFWFQHDPRLRAGNVMTIFDNGAAPAKEPASRALFVRLDVKRHEATLLKALTYPLHTVLAYALGNVEPLPNGDVVVGWGTAPNYSVFSRSGKLTYDATLPKGDDSYRVFERSWSATPETKPSLVVEGAGKHATLAMSWNGATGVSSWAIFSGPSPSHLRKAGTVTSRGFQTTARVALGAFVEVAALDRQGKVIGRSRIERS